MDLVMLPLHCVLNHSVPSDSKLSAGRDALLKEMFSSKCQCVTILTHSLCALDNMLVQVSVYEASLSLPLVFFFFFFFFEHDCNLKRWKT